MTKTLLTVAAVSCTAISAQAQDKSNTQPDTLNLFGAYSAGYLFESEEIQHTLRFGVEHVSTLYYLQLGFYNLDGLFGFDENELDALSVSAGVTGRRQLARNFVGYIGGSLGIMNAEGSAGSGTFADDNTFYADAVAGFELLVSENISFNTGVRGIYADSITFNGVDFDTFGSDLDQNYDIAIELGVIVRF